jgi:RNA polymerase sigma factor (sigma-70 family)
LNAQTDIKWQESFNFPRQGRARQKHVRFDRGRAIECLGASRGPLPEGVRRTRVNGGERGLLQSTRVQFALTGTVRMSAENAFLDLIRRVRAGDENAAAELVQRYEPAIRRAVRLRLRDSRLRRVLDSMDIVQSVMISFFVRAASGQYKLEEPNQLINLLVAMARNKLATQARKPDVVRREPASRLAGSEIRERPAPGPSPSQLAAGRDLLQAVRRQLSSDELHLVDRRAQGWEWAEIGTELGDSPEALRKKLARALDRAAQHLRLDELL